MPVWMTLGWRAYWRTFNCGRFSCIGGGRDFAWLTLLLSLVVAMALLMVGSRAGLLDRFTDALLGTLRPYGVPIWATAHWQNQNGIQSELLNRLDELQTRIPGESFGITAYPYRRVASNVPQISLPSDTIWNPSIPLIGWAVYPDDPLWNVDNQKSAHVSGDSKGPWLGLPLTLVLNETLFANQFDYAQYREAIQPLLEEKKLRRLPEHLTNGKLKDTLSTLWLKVAVGDQENLIPFEVRWASHLPAMEKVAYLFPLTTYNALLAAHHFPDLKYDPILQGKGSPKATERLTSPAYPVGQLERFVLCVSQEVAATGLTEIPEIQWDRCQKPKLPPGLGVVSGQVEPSSSLTDTLNHDRNNRLWMPCHRFPRSNPLRNELCPDWRSDSTGSPLFLPWDVTSYGTPFEAVHIYVPDPTKLSKGILSILALRTLDGTQALNVHPMYQDALNRFNLLSDLLSTMVPAYALTFGAFLGALLMAQVGALIGHRRHHYGILLSRGVRWSGIYAKIIWQMALATIVASLLSVTMMVPGLKWLLEDGFMGVITNYKGLLPPGVEFEVLPLPWISIVGTVGQVFLLVVVVTLFLLFRLPLRGSTAPSDLLHGDGRAPRKSRRRNGYVGS